MKDQLHHCAFRLASYCIVLPRVSQVEIDGDELPVIGSSEHCSRSLCQILTRFAKFTTFYQRPLSFVKRAAFEVVFQVRLKYTSLYGFKVTFTLVIVLLIRLEV